MPLFQESLKWEEHDKNRQFWLHEPEATAAARASAPVAGTRTKPWPEHPEGDGALGERRHQPQSGHWATRARRQPPAPRNAWGSFDSVRTCGLNKTLLRQRPCHPAQQPASTQPRAPREEPPSA